jgi:hypothetical protein
MTTRTADGAWVVEAQADRIGVTAARHTLSGKTSRV